MIHIPDPCKEDFSKMTPTEKGAFCTKCSTDTYDFRNLSNNEINTIIKDNKGGHVCGRFTSNQLMELNAGFTNWKYQNTKTFQSKFVFALIMVFGFGLFSCDNENDSAIEMVKNIENIERPESIINYINEEIEVSQLDLLDYVADNLEAAELETIFYEQDVLGGAVIQENEILKEDIYYDHGTMLAGMIAYDPQYVNYVEVTIEDTVQESILPDPIEIDLNVFTAKAFPNPTQTNSTISLQIEKEGQFEIMLYNMSGQMIKNIHSGELSTGRQTFEIDMYDLNSGMYIVQIVSQGQNETLKIQKLN
jgi:hypothetical protein